VDLRVKRMIDSIHHLAEVLTAAQRECEDR
jgi:hypothetical protein